MSAIQTLFGAGRLLAQNHLLALVEYALVITLVGKRQVASGSVLVLDGPHDLSDQTGLRLQLQDGTFAHIAVAPGPAAGQYQVTGMVSL